MKLYSLHTCQTHTILRRKQLSESVDDKRHRVYFATHLCTSIENIRLLAIAGLWEKAETQINSRARFLIHSKGVLKITVYRFVCIGHRWKWINEQWRKALNANAFRQTHPLPVSFSFLKLSDKRFWFGFGASVCW